MKNNRNFPDYPRLQEYYLRAHEIAKNLAESIMQLREAMQPIIEVIEESKPQIVEVGKTIANIMRPLYAIKKMGEAQFVYWDYMPPEFVDAIIASDNVNKTLGQYIIKKYHQKVLQIIEVSQKNDLIKKHHRLYMQSVDAYKNGNSDLAVTGFTSVFDGVLAGVSKNATHKLPPRIKVIKEKLEKEEVLDNDEYAMLTLALTFEKTIDSFSEIRPFSGKEPKGLNRHWIAHGRSTRKKTKLDCVKLINLIYGLLLIDELDSQKERENNE